MNNNIQTYFNSNSANEPPLAFECTQETAAIKIQKNWRGYFVRCQNNKLKKQRFLDPHHFEIAKTYINTPDNYEDLPRAPFGNCRPYLLEEPPLVLKRVCKDSQTRFQKMQRGHEICELNKYQSVVIPRARIYKDFIIESKLPITAPMLKEQIGLYSDNRDKFNRAVTEFTSFLCQSTLNDITGKDELGYATLSNIGCGRYDNVCLYVEEDLGKIGLIDLEDFSPQCDIKESSWCFFKCLKAVLLFPYHLDEIMNEARKFDPNIQQYRQELTNQKNEALKFFNLMYDNHLNFIREKMISIEDPTKIPEITPVRLKELEEKTISFIQKTKNNLKTEEDLKKFAEVFPEILRLILIFLVILLKRKQRTDAKTICSHLQVLSLRSIIFSTDDDKFERLVDIVKNRLSPILGLKEEYCGSYRRVNNRVIEIIIQAIFTELAQGREFAYYNPQFLAGSQQQCIFF